MFNKKPPDCNNHFCRFPTDHSIEVRFTRPDQSFRPMKALLYLHRSQVELQSLVKLCFVLRAGNLINGERSFFRHGEPTETEGRCTGERLVTYVSGKRQPLGRSGRRKSFTIRTTVEEGLLNSITVPRAGDTRGRNGERAGIHCRLSSSYREYPRSIKLQRAEPYRELQNSTTGKHSPQILCQ